jgi:HrpA-like RNA helicase
MDTVPADDYVTKVLKVLETSRVVIVMGKTGSGKSTRITKGLADGGWCVVVNEHARIAVQSLAEYVSIGTGVLGDSVGYRMSGTRVDCPYTPLTFMTYGLTLARILNGHDRATLHVLDELHKRTADTDVLLALMKERLKLDPHLHVVIMSATLEAERLSAYFGRAPIITIPGRTHQITQRVRGDSELEDVLAALRGGESLWWFQPGKAEIAAAIQAVKRSGVSAECIPLHAELTDVEQAKCFGTYEIPKLIVTTDIADTAITVPGMVGAVLSGIVRCMRIVDGVPGLYYATASEATLEQQGGRVGRTEDGWNTNWCTAESRPKYAEPEILNIRLDDYVLRFAAVGRRFEDVDLFDRPPPQAYADAYRRLEMLGCVDSRRQVTPLGKQVARLPLAAPHGVMLVRAAEFKVTRDVLTAVSILNVKSIVASKVLRGTDEVDGRSIAYARFCPDERTSDVLAEIAVYNKAMKLTAEEQRQSGVFVKMYTKAQVTRAALEKALLEMGVDVATVSDRAGTIKALCAGMVDTLHERRGDTYGAVGATGRQLNRVTCIQPAQWVIGTPFDLEVRTSEGGTKVLNLLQHATAVDTDWLCEVAPHLVEQRQTGASRFKKNSGETVVPNEMYFNDMLVKSGKAPLVKVKRDLARAERDARFAAKRLRFNTADAEA